MRLSEIMAYHGSANVRDGFNTTHSGNNSTALGDYRSTRFGVFFSDNPVFSRIYGNVGLYELDIHNTAEDLENLAYDCSNTLDPHNPDERTEWLALRYYASYGENNGDIWGLFEDDLGEIFVPWLTKQGYDSATFVEYHTDNTGNDVRSTTIVVFDPKRIKYVRDITDEKLDDLSESFFSSNADILMPVVKSLMKTGARPLIYKLWKKSPNAVLALAAIQKLKDEGDANPINTIYRLTDLDVPMQFMKRLAYDAGITGINGVSGDHKPTLNP